MAGATHDGQLAITTQELQAMAGKSWAAALRLACHPQVYRHQTAGRDRGRRHLADGPDRDLRRCACSL